MVPDLNSGDLRGDFVRQRRNLMAISIVLLAFLCGVVNVKEDVSFFGTGIVFADVQNLKYALWLFWFYFYVRYAVYLNDAKSLESITAVYNTKYEFIKRELFKIAKSSEHEFVRVDRFFTPEEQGEWAAEVVYKRINGKGLFADYINLDNKAVSFCQIKARIVVFFKTRYFTEYTLPFIVGALPLFVQMYFLISKYFGFAH